MPLIVAKPSQAAAGTTWRDSIRYAPFAANEAFFEKYHERILVINGVGAQTNSHTVGVVHNWRSETGGVARFTRMNNPHLLRNIATPQIPHWNTDARYFSDADWAALEARRAASARRLGDADGLLPGEARNREFHRSAFAAADGLAAYAAALPSSDELEQPERYQGANYKLPQRPFHGTDAEGSVATGGVCSMKVSTPGPGRGRAGNCCGERSAVRQNGAAPGRGRTPSGALVPA